MDEWMTGITRLRRQLCARAEGKTLEVACGTARNFRFYNSHLVHPEASLTQLSRGSISSKEIENHGISVFIDVVDWLQSNVTNS